MFRANLKLVIAASSLGTMFEWYDFFVYGTLAGLFSKLFFPAASASAGLLLALATFGVGFAMRPVGAAVFGILGDRIGRKYTFMATITLMGIATAGIGVLPTFETAGVWAPVMLVTLRALQGFALGGEYGGAAVYVAEYAPAHRRGFFTGFIQAGVPAGLMLSLLIAMISNWAAGPTNWTVWGWRLPFLFSLVLLGISLWLRISLAESPVFKAMQEAGTIAVHPLRESFDSWPKVRSMLIALAVTAGQAVGTYMALFQAAYFMQNALHVNSAAVRTCALLAASVGIGTYILGGWCSDRLGRKKPIVAGFVLTLLLLFPLFHVIAYLGNPTLEAAMRRSAVVVQGSECYYNPFLTRGQRTECGRLLGALSKNGIAYTTRPPTSGEGPTVTIDGVPTDGRNEALLLEKLKSAGFSLDPSNPAARDIVLLALVLAALYLVAGLTYGPLAAWLVEMFPARVRYTSLSIPYHVANGYAGGFLPLVSQYIVVKTGDPYAGLWYPMVFVALGLFVAVFFLRETVPNVSQNDS